MGDHLLTADILRESGAEWNSEESFQVVLTPSCDLAPGKSDRPKAHRVLVACCERIDRFGKVGPKPGRPLSRKNRDEIGRFLNEGIANGLLPIPPLRGQVPIMVANLKRLELIEWEDIQLTISEGEPSSTFQRVASTDSPFREMVVWAYLRVTGRPGVPMVDIGQWLDDISDHFRARGPT